VALTSAAVLPWLVVGCGPRPAPAIPAEATSAPTEPGVEALVGASADKEFADVSPGDTVAILGECLSSQDGKNVSLHMCHRYLGYRPGVPADALFRAFDSDRGAATKTYGRNTFVVRGVLTAKQPNKIYLSGVKAPAAAAPGLTGKRPPDERDPTTVKPDVTMTAAELLAELTRDEEKTKAKYAGKVLELTGEVARANAFQSVHLAQLMLNESS
jgi:hypothetical protein